MPYLGIWCARPPYKSCFVAVEPGVDAKVQTVQLRVEQYIWLDTVHTDSVIHR